MRVTFDRSGVLVVGRELWDTPLGAEVYLPDIQPKDRVVLDRVEISAEARAADRKRKAA